MVTDAASALAPFLDDPGRAAILFDFDGTLAPIVDDPRAARPLAGAYDLLGQLAERYKVVAVLSGRPVSFLEPLVPPGVVLSGLYGLEVVHGGARSDHPYSGAWREVVADVARSSVDRGPAGMRVETKGLSLTLHYRTRPELAREVEDWARRQAARSGLVIRPARMSVELHPPIDADKGTAAESIVRRAEAVCFVGDDVGDLPAFDALDRLAARGVHTLRVAVVSDESPDELVRRADLVLEGPDAVLGLLRTLAGAATGDHPEGAGGAGDAGHGARSGDTGAADAEAAAGAGTEATATGADVAPPDAAPPDAPPAAGTADAAPPDVAPPDAGTPGDRASAAQRRTDAGGPADAGAAGAQGR